jgi:hypothetical protein
MGAARSTICRPTPHLLSGQCGQMRRPGTPHDQRGEQRSQPRDTTTRQTLSGRVVERRVPTRGGEKGGTGLDRPTSIDDGVLMISRRRRPDDTTPSKKTRRVAPWRVSAWVSTGACACVCGCGPRLSMSCRYGRPSQQVPWMEREREREREVESATQQLSANTMRPPKFSPESLSSSRAHKQARPAGPAPCDSGGKLV